jgi:hypothetical protein
MEGDKEKALAAGFNAYFQARESQITPTPDGVTAE